MHIQVFSIQTLRAQIFWANSSLKYKANCDFKKCMMLCMQCANVCGCADFKTYFVSLLLLHRSTYANYISNPFFALHVCPDHPLIQILGAMIIIQCVRFHSCAWVFPCMLKDGLKVFACMHAHVLWLLYFDSYSGRFQLVVFIFSPTAVYRKSI